MQLWHLLVGGTILLAVLEFFVLLRLEIEPRPKAMILAASCTVPMIMFFVFRVIQPELGATPIF